MASPIPISKPCFGDEELQAVQQPLRDGWVAQGPRVRAFEERFAAFTGAPHAVATTSCTTALHLALAALGVGPGDEVIVPAFTWVATANVVAHLGATPVFCDIDLATFNLDPAQLGALVTPRTVGLLPVHLFGLCADMGAVAAVAARHGLFVVEDAACALGSSYAGRHAGTMGEAGCFSFHPRKSITTGEGGMLTTADPALDGRLRALRDHGAARAATPDPAPAFLLPDFPDAGYNYRMTDVQGALGVAQMARAGWILERRAEVARRYDAALAGLPGLRTPTVPDGYVHSYQAYVCLFAPEPPSLANVARLHAGRNAVMARLEADGIATRQGTHAPVLAGYYARRYGLRPEQYPNATLADRLSLALPLYPQLTAEEQDRVCDALAAAVAASDPAPCVALADAPCGA